MKLKVVKTTATVYKWICPECGKVLQSLHLGQTNAYANTHWFTHDKKRKEVENG